MHDNFVELKNSPTTTKKSMLRKENCNFAMEKLSWLFISAFSTFISASSFFINFSSLSAPTKIELTTGSDEKTQRSPAGN